MAGFSASHLIFLCYTLFYMEQERIQPSAEELVLCNDNAITCETYLFEPASAEQRLGFLFVAGETESRGGIGKPLLDSVISAIQKEYYRNPSRSSSSSFEMALHQANLILHDTVEAGVKDWMGHFHVAVGVLAGDQLHISVAGAGAVFLSRKSVSTNISQGLSHFPITNPLKTFSQVASGIVTTRDVLFFTSSTFDAVFRSVDVGRFALEHSASTIASRLEQLYLDQGHKVPLSVTVVTLLPEYIAEPKKEIPHHRNAQPVGTGAPALQPRSPLIIRRSTIQNTIKSIWNITKNHIWPYIQQRFSRGGKIIAQAAKQSTKKIPTLTMPKLSLTSTARGIRSLPSSSKIFAVIACILLIALAGSIILLRQKQASDKEIQASSEQLHEARIKLEAAKTALIYDNRQQASGLLNDAKKIADTLSAGSLYVQETQALKKDIQTEEDRLQKIFRANAANSHTIGDMSSATNGKLPKRIFFVDGALYAANPDTNTIIQMSLDGTAKPVHQTTSGIGFITGGSAQNSEKTITFSTSPAGVALFDAKDSSLTSQNITLPAEKSAITDMALFGNRLYIYDATEKNIFSYNKTLRGYVGGTPWITDANAPNKDITSFAIDGNIYALTSSGKIFKLFRGALADFVQASVEPSLASATRIITSDTMQNLYVFDRTNKRVVIYSKKGALLRQLYIDTAKSLTDITVSPDEQRIYALDGTTVLNIALTDQLSPTPAP